MITTQQFPDLVKNAKVIWRKAFMGVPKVAAQLYDVYRVDEKTSEHSEMDGSTFALRKKEGDEYRESKVVQGYKYNFSQTRIGLEKKITYEMRKFDKYREIERLMSMLGETTANRLELDMTHQLSYGFVDSYVNLDGETVSTATADGLSNFHAAHTLTGTDKTYSNKITKKFGRAALEEAELLFTNMKDNLGEKITMRPNIIVTSDDPATINKVREFLKSTSQVNEGNANGRGQNDTTNVYGGKYTHVILPYLATDNAGQYDATKKDQWYLACTKESRAVCEISDYPKFVAPNVSDNSIDWYTDDIGFKSNMMYDLGWIDGRWIVGSTGVDAAV